MQLERREQSLIVLVAMLIGFLFIILLKANGVSGTQVTRQKTAVPSLIQTEQENQQLANDNEKIKQELVKYAQGQSSLALATQQLKEAKMNAGLIAVTGSGIRITLDDSKSVARGVDVNNYLNKLNILNIFNALWNGGAEAIAVNGQRVTTNTEVYCLESYIQINGTRQMPPYVIEAVGETSKISSALNFYVVYQLADLQKQHGITSKIEVLDKIMIPAGKLVDYRFAEPAKEGT